MLSTISRPLFSDEIIRATDLNRTPGAVLDKAARTPVTIVRNEECFALLNRNVFAGLVLEADQKGKVLDLLGAAFQALHCGSLSKESPHGWLLAFDKDDIQELVGEVLKAFHDAPFVDDGWEELEAVIHEWHESAIAVLSDDFAEAFVDEPDEVPLTPPSD